MMQATVIESKLGRSIPIWIMLWSVALSIAMVRGHKESSRFETIDLTYAWQPSSQYNLWSDTDLLSYVSIALVAVWTVGVTWSVLGESAAPAETPVSNSWKTSIRKVGRKPRFWFALGLLANILTVWSLTSADETYAYSPLSSLVGTVIACSAPPIAIWAWTRRSIRQSQNREPNRQTIARMLSATAVIAVCIGAWQLVSRDAAMDTSQWGAAALAVGWLAILLFCLADRLWLAWLMIPVLAIQLAIIATAAFLNDQSDAEEVAWLVLFLILFDLVCVFLTALIRSAGYRWMLSKKQHAVVTNSGEAVAAA